MRPRKAGGRKSASRRNKTDKLYYDYATDQLILLDMSQEWLTERVTHGTVIATFENGNLVTGDIWFG